MHIGDGGQNAAWDCSNASLLLSKKDFATEAEVATAIAQGVSYEPSMNQEKQKHWQRNTRSIQRHRKTTKKAQKWADLIGVTLKETEDPTLLLYTKEDKNNQPRWIVIR